MHLISMLKLEMSCCGAVCITGLSVRIILGRYDTISDERNSLDSNDTKHMVKAIVVFG